MALTLAACSRSPEAPDLVELRRLIDGKEASSAAVQLKVLLAGRPDDADLRFLHGRALLESGDARGSEVEFERAIELGHSADEASVPLARAWIVLGKYAQVVARFDPASPGRDTSVKPSADLLTLVATAHRQQGKLSEAETVTAEVLSRWPDHTPALLMQANLKAARGDPRQALAGIADVIRREPENAQAWLMRGQIEFGMGDDDGAIEALRRSLKIRADSVSAHSALVALFVARGRIDDARAQWESMRGALPSNPATRQVEAKLALLDGKPQRARELANELLRSSESVELLQLAAAAEWALNARERATSLLQRALQRSPQARVPRLMLAQTQIAGGQYDGAEQALKPLVGAAQPDTVALALMAQVRLLQGDAKGADRLFRQAEVAAGAPGGSLSAQGVAELAGLAPALATGATTGPALARISGLLAKGDIASASRELNALETQLPKAAVVDELRGRIALQQRKGAEAARHFEAALAKDPAHYAAVASLAAIDMSAGKPDAAAARLEAFRGAHADHLPATLALAEVWSRRAATLDKVVPLLREAASRSPDQAGAHLMLVAHLRSANQVAPAIAAAQAGLATLPDHPLLLEALGRAHAAAGSVQQATSSFTRLAQAMPGTALPHLLSAEVHINNKDLAAARESVRRARAAEPRSAAALRLAAALEVKDGRFAEALALAREAQRHEPNQAAGHAMEAEILVLQGDTAGAEKALRRGLEKEDPATSARYLYNLLNTQKRFAEADRFAEAWLAAHKRDAGMHRAVANAALGRQEWARAEKHFVHLVEHDPVDVEALNNLAWLLARRGNGGAVPMAERSLKLSPGNPAIMDTLAHSHAAAKDIGRAIEWQRKAVQAAPKLGKLRLNLAKFYLSNGQRDEAVAELGRVVSDTGPGPSRDEATRLLARLRGTG